MSNNREEILARFQKFISFRNRFSLGISLVVFLCFYLFILMIGFYPNVLGYTLGPSSITLGILFGIGIIIISILSTGIYTLFANKYFDKEQEEILQSLKENGLLEDLQKNGLKKEKK